MHIEPFDARLDRRSPARPHSGLTGSFEFNSASSSANVTIGQPLLLVLGSQRAAMGEGLPDYGVKVTVMSSKDAVAKVVCRPIWPLEARVLVACSTGMPSMLA